MIPDLDAAPLPLVIGISGRIAAGKTTAARWFEAMGFAYTRVSLVIDDEIVARGLQLDRATRQRIGMELHDQRGQAWLCERAVARVGAARHIVVDGLRWPQDHAFFVERFGDQFLHLHLTAPPEVRAARSGVDAGGFAAADAQPVESGIDGLASLATKVIENTGTIDEFESEIARLIVRVAEEGR